MPTNTTAEIHHRSWPNLPVTSSVESQLPSPAPTTIATTVVSPMTPLAAEIFFDRSISGMLPSFAGPKSAACEPISATITNIRYMLPMRIVAMARAMMTISAILHLTITSRLLKRSAR
jgi:hypothetical protein